MLTRAELKQRAKIVSIYFKLKECKECPCYDFFLILSFGYATADIYGYQGQALCFTSLTSINTCCVLSPRRI